MPFALAASTDGQIGAAIETRAIWRTAGPRRCRAYRRARVDRAHRRLRSGQKRGGPG